MSLDPAHILLIFISKSYPESTILAFVIGHRRIMVLFGMTFATVVIALMEIVQPKKRWMAIMTRMNGREQWYIAGFLLMMLTAWAYKIGLVRHFLFNPA